MTVGTTFTDDHFRPLNDREILNLAAAIIRYPRWQQFQIEIRERQHRERALRRQLRRRREGAAA